MLIPPCILRSGIEKVCDPSGVRYALGGLLLERTEDGRASIAATDGRRLVYARWSDEKEMKEFPPLRNFSACAGAKERFSAIVLKEHWTEAVKLPSRRVLKPILTWLGVDESAIDGDDGRIIFGASDLSAERLLIVRPLEGRFPDISSYVALMDSSVAGDKRTEVDVDARYLSETVAIVHKAAGTDEDVHGVTVRTDGPGGEVILRASGVADVIGLIMPLARD